MCTIYIYIYTRHASNACRYTVVLVYIYMYICVDRAIKSNWYKRATYTRAGEQNNNNKKN